MAPASGPLYYTRWTARQTDGVSSKLAQIVMIILIVTVFVTCALKDADSVQRHAEGQATAARLVR